MDLVFIILLIFFGLLFLIAEILLLPGVSIGALLALACDGSAVYLAFRDFDVAGGVLVIVIIALLSLIATVYSLRAKTWQRFSLKAKIGSVSMDVPSEHNVRIGDRGVTVSRLSPMGKVEIGGKMFEAKSQGGYVDPRTEIEVIGFENFNVIVKTLN